MIHIKLLVLGLASLCVGLFRGITFRLAPYGELLCNAKDPVPPAAQPVKPDYKKMHAEATGIDPAASDDDAVAAHQAHMKAVAASLDNEAGDDPDVADNAKKEAADALLLENAKKETEALTNTRAELAGVLINAAVEKAFVLPADVEGWKTKFAADFDGTKTLLANQKTPLLKLDPKTKALGARSGEIVTNEADRRDKIELLVNEAMEKRKLSYTDAFVSVQKKHPELFSAAVKK